MGTSLAAISRIERGQHRASARMRRRLATALEIDSMTGFEHVTEQPVREIVVG
jgi:transcriptional regulator with XRE-family HTH domain